MNKFTVWEPQAGWLVMLPARIPPVQGGIILPETHTKKANSGITVKAGSVIDRELFEDKECFFPSHSEYQIVDTDTGYLLYVVESKNIILTRTPHPDVERFSREKPSDDFKPETIESNQLRQ
jgi:hypothetical protein